jgi:hypothetical protein
MNNMNTKEHNKDEPCTMLKALCVETDTNPSDWDETSGPETGVGVERWYVSRLTGEAAYVVDDQGHITVETYPEEELND